MVTLGLELLLCAVVLAAGEVTVALVDGAVGVVWECAVEISAACPWPCWSEEQAAPARHSTAAPAAINFDDMWVPPVTSVSR